MNKKYIQGGKHYINNVYVYMKAIIFRAAGGGIRLFDKISERYEIIAAVDNDSKKWGKYINNVLISNPQDRLMKKDYDTIIITSVPGKDSIIEQLKEYNIDENKINTGYVDLPLDSRRVFCENMAQLHKDIPDNICVAEAGVFQGDFAKIINQNYKNKKLYLFDTFEGFSEKDIAYEKGFSKAEAGDYNLTSIDIVMNKMKFPQNCVIRQGFFPETAIGIEEKFCFVNLDMDLYRPTLMGLEWFKDKMVSSGCILIHDYFTDNFTGVKRAVEEFLAENNKLYKLPIGDGISIAIVGF